jgi:hypothetical protein
LGGVQFLDQVGGEDDFEPVQGVGDELLAPGCFTLVHGLVSPILTTIEARMSQHQALSTMAIHTWSL